MSLLEDIVVGVIIIVGLIIFYTALKEPLDLLFGLIKRGTIAARDKIQDMRGNRAAEYVEQIRYG